MLNITRLVLHMKFSIISSVFRDRRGEVSTVAIIIGMVIIGLGILVSNQLQDPSKRINILPRATTGNYPVQSAWTNEGTTTTIDDRIDFMVTNFPCSEESRNQVKVYYSRNNNIEIGLMKDYSLPVPTAAGTKGTCYFGRWPNDQAELKSYYRFYGTKEELRQKGLPQYIKLAIPGLTQYSNEVDLGGPVATPIPTATACVPVQNGPANNAVVSTNPTFSWTACAGTNIKYNFVVTGNGVSYTASFVNITSYSITNPIPAWQSGSVYAWKIKKCTNADCVGGTFSPEFKFTFLAPTPTNFPSTTLSCSVSGTNVTWTWGTVAGAVDYFLDIKGSDGSSFSEGWVGTNTRSKTITGNPGITYTGKVMGTSAQRKNGTFVSSACTVPYPTPTPFCTDSDGGKNYSTYGKIQYRKSGSSNLGNVDDACAPVQNVLWEEYCGANYGPEAESYTCPYGCANGACKPASTPTLTKTPTPTPTMTPAPTCPRKPQGDANCNNTIDIADQGIWLSEYLICVNTTTKKCAADFDSKENVAILDFAIWQVNYIKEIIQK